MAKEHNKIEIHLKPDERGKFGYDCINIDVNNTSFGALQIFQKDLKKLAEEWRKKDDECWHPVTAAYAALLEKLSAVLLAELSNSKSLNK